MKLVSRKDARAAGLALYFTGKSCKYGHICQRRLPGCVCIECNKVTTKRWKLANAERTRGHVNRHNRKKRGLPEAPYPCPEFCEAKCGRKARDLDHDHETGQFRGWLCGCCNRGLGLIGDNLRATTRMTTYLKRTPRT